MNIKQSLYKNDTKVSRLYKDGCLSLASIGSDPAFSSLDDFASINKYWKYKISEDSEIVSSLDDAVKDYAYLTTDKKWYAKNTSGFYEEYGIYENVDNLDPYHSESRLPEGYTEVEYIENNSGAYIDTGVSGGSNAKTQIKLQINSSRNNYQQYFAGDNSNQFPKLYEEASITALCIPYRNASGSTVSYNYTIKIGVDYDIVMDNTSGSLLVSVNDENVINSANTQYGYGTLSYYIFNGHEENTLISYMRLYSCKMWKDGELVREFVPCRNSSDVYGLYDIVNDEFYSSVNSSYNFVGGPDVSTHTGVSCYTGKLVVLSTDSHEYKWNGTEWVDLGEFIQVPKTFNAASSSYSFTLSSLPNGLQYSYDVEAKFKMPAAKAAMSLSSTNALIIGNTAKDGSDYETFIISDTMYMDAPGAATYRQSKSSVSSYLSYDTWYIFQMCDKNYLDTEHRALYIWDESKTSKKISVTGTSKNTTTLSDKVIRFNTCYTYEYIDIYDSTGKIVSLVPKQKSDGTACLYDQLNNVEVTTAGGSLEFTYEGDVPEYYPDRPTPSSSVTESSYHNFLTDDYYNGQSVKVYKKKYDVVDGEMVENTKKDTYALFDGNSWFNTGWVVPQTLTLVEVSWMAQQDNYILGTTSPKTIYGVGADTPGIFLLYNTGSSSFELRYGNTGTAYPSFSNIKAGDIFVLTMNIENNSNVSVSATQNGTVVYTSSTTSSFGGNSLPLWIARTNPFGWEDATDGRLLYLKFTDNGTLAHHYTFEEVDGVGKMYDSVEGKYFNNAGDGSITVVDLE